MSGLTSSGGERAFECLASQVLPRHPHSSIAAEHGNENHAKAEREDLHEKHKAFLAKLTRVQTEVSYVLDTEKRTIQHTGYRRKYGNLGPYQVGTTPDVVGWLNDIPVSIDWKSRKRVTSASRNLQIRAQALAMSMYASSNVIAGIGYLDDGYLELVTFGPIEIAAAWADWHELCGRVDRFKHLYAENPSIQITPRRGEWCAYCDSLLVCSSQNAALATFRSELAESVDISALSDEKVFALYEIWSQVKKRGEQFEEALKARASLIPIRDGKGKMLEMRPNKGRPSTDWRALEEKLESIGDKISNYQTRVPFMKLTKVNDTTGDKQHG